MGPRERISLIAAACLAAGLLPGAHAAIAVPAVTEAQAPVPADALEPAKAAIRVKDYAGAARLLSEQAARDNADAQYLLGAMVLADLVPQGERDQARRLFETAAAHGQARAALALAAMLARGEPSDAAGAKRWLERARELGDPDARELLRRGVLPLEVRPQDSLLDEASRRIELWRAARRGDVAVLDVLATPERVNVADDFGRTALHHAADGGATAAVSLLLARGAKIEASDEYGVTPLMLACAADPPDTCARLLLAKASVTAADLSGNTALAYATRSRRTEQAKDLRAAGSAPVRAPLMAVSSGPMDRLPRAAVDAYAGWPDVVVAASRRDPTRLRELLGHGADPNATAPDGQTALSAAVASDSAPAAALLLDAGADISRSDARGATPMDLAVRLSHDAVLEVLLKHSANPNAHGTREPPPLIVAVGNGDARAIRQLLAAGADANSRDERGTTPLTIAAARDQADIVSVLIDARALPSTADSSGRTALWFAACSDSAGTVPLLLKAGATIDAADVDGVTPLACAAARGHTAIVDRLVQSGANVAARTRTGDTPLTLAATGGHAGTARRLLTAGADANAQNRLGDTALILASQSGSIETVQALLDAGASRKLRNRDGVAASDAARARSFDNVVALLNR